MPISDYLKGLRDHVGHDLIVTPGSAAIIRNDAGEVLLQRRADNGLWSLLGGATDPGEAPALTLVREVFEESGLRVRPVRLAGVFGGREWVYPNGDRLEMTVTVFDCAVVGGVLQAHDGESVELRFFAAEALPESPMLERYPAAIFAREPDPPATFDWDETWLDGLVGLAER